MGASGGAGFMSGAQAGRWGRPARGRRGRAVSLGALLALVAGLLTGCVQSSGSGTGLAGSLTLYSGQHVQTTDELVHGVREADRHLGERPLGRRGRAGRPDRHRGFPLAGRRVLHRELAAPAVPGLQGPAGAGRPVHPGQDAEPVQLPGRAMGGRLGPGQRDVYNTALLKAASCRRRSWTWPIPRGRGRSRVAGSETDFQPIVTSHRTAPTATLPRCTGWRASRPTPGATSIPTTRR